MIHIPSDSCAGRTGAGNEPARSAGRDGGDAVDLLSPTLLVVFAAWFLCGFVNGIAGIGAAMVAMPIVSCVMDIHLAILSSCIGGTAVGFFVAVMYAGTASAGSSGSWRWAAFPARRSEP